MNKDLLITIIESFYVIYMFNFFKTTLYIHHPFESLFFGLSNYLKHPIESSEYDSKICPLGNIVGYIFGLLIIFRYLYKNRINKLIILSLFFGTLLTNINSFIYFIPIFFYELSLF
jgi:hypothetical protein